MPAASPTTTKLKRRCYYTNGLELFYIKDYMPDKDYMLVEDCFSLDTKWVKTSILIRSKLTAVGVLKKKGVAAEYE
jgi:hypothetical protein